MIMPHDPFDTIAGSLQNVFVRLALFALSVALGFIVGAAGRTLIHGANTELFFAASMIAVPTVSLATLVVLIQVESTAAVGAALAVNCLAWCWVALFCLSLLGGF